MWSRQFGGPVRKWSADRIVEIVSALARDKNDDMVVLVPFRAQRSMIRRRLRDAGFNRVPVSTVHRAQGSQRHTVIFDPVDGASNFITDPNIGPRLINVAVSRAKARIVLLLSAGDMRNPLLDQIARLADPPRKVVAALPLEEIVHRPGFPTAFVGKDVAFRAIIGRFKGYSADQQKLVIAEASTQRDRRISVKMFPAIGEKQAAQPSPGGMARAALGDDRPKRSAAHEAMQVEIDRLRAENERLARAQNSGIALKVSEKGALSVYGFGQFPVTLYREQWITLLDNAKAIRNFIADHPLLKTKGQ